ncbi:hypothetical protein Ahy_B08g092937 [Arachis hypogaea]|uniref:Uncharacterized protein n=1 Tax=Arachis hypogaea TaxID=3818 RepID=A0A444Y4Y2_ARAHY|nr:hypothetical protein Ahy_B08g092937 [Arachis hypogaea]
MGVQPPHFEHKTCESLKKGRKIVVLLLEEMRKLKTERKKQFLEVLYQLQNISTELYGSKGANASRLKQVFDLLNTLSSLCSVLGLDIKDKLGEICPTLVTSTASKEISDNTIKILSSEVKSLREVKSHTMQKLLDPSFDFLQDSVIETAKEVAVSGDDEDDGVNRPDVRKGDNDVVISETAIDVLQESDERFGGLLFRTALQ